ncbi:MAG: aldo/keto reductase [Gammaproteobacteria bacterium]|nr:aldo/keto reductase [Gammaproteobacteria bacterium]
MKDNYPIKNLFNNTSRIVYGCMGLGGDWDSPSFEQHHINQAHQVLDAALEHGITQFDHADIYTRGKAERVFGEVLKQRPELKDQISIQSKCGIRFADEQHPGRYDFSKDWIISSTEGILKRLNVEHIDTLILHRPDPLVEPEEVALAFEHLKQQGKVRHFGASNMHLHQLQFLNSALEQPLIVNQLELSLTQLGWLDEGVTSLGAGDKAVNFSSGTIEYCRQNNVQLQSWGCLSQGLFTGRALDNQPDFIHNTAAKVDALATRYQVSKEAIVLAWLMRHPAQIQPVIGTTNPQRIAQCAEAVNVELSREDWYSLYVSARGEALP